MYGNMGEALKRDLQELRDAGLYKEERIIRSKQDALIEVEHPPGSPPRKVINFCANNYLGLSNHPVLISAAQKAIGKLGFGMSSVRFICGTQDRHKLLETRLAEFLGTEDSILYAACFDANGGVFEPLLSEEDVILTDQLNHASIIDGLRLSGAQKRIFPHLDIDALERELAHPHPGGRTFIVTESYFSMDGDIAPLERYAALAEEYSASLLVDDAHATGLFGSERGTCRGGGSRPTRRGRGQWASGPRF